VYIKKDPSETINESNIIINEISTEKVKFGDKIDTDLEIYRGDTSKYAIYIYIIDSDGKTIGDKTTLHMKQKFSAYSIMMPIQIDYNCQKKYPDGEYMVVAEGLNVMDKKSIRIEGIDEKICKTEAKDEDDDKKRGTLAYDIIEMPQTIYLNMSFDIRLKITNDYDNDIDLEVWSYIYRGPKKYSEEKENLKYITVVKEDKIEVILKNIVKQGETGEYKLKVRLLREGRKTTIDKTKDVHLIAPEIPVEKIKRDKSQNSELYVYNQQNISLSQKLASTNSSKRQSGLIYESDYFMTKKILPLFILILFTLAVIFLLIMIKVQKSKS
jgi:hypothetical protein